MNQYNHDRQKKFYFRLAGVFGVAAGIILGALIILLRFNTGPLASLGEGPAEIRANTPADDLDVQTDGDIAQSLDSVPDNGISITNVPDGEQLVDDQAAGYYFHMPASSYVEKTGDSGVTVYPNYDPATDSAAPATCKIQLSVLGAGGISDLNGWVSARLYTDPTANVLEISSSSIDISGTLALEWRGILNGVTSTLVYALVGNSVFEIAPSTLSENADADNDNCGQSFQSFIKNLTFGNYAG